MSGYTLGAGYWLGTCQMVGCHKEATTRLAFSLCDDCKASTEELARVWQPRDGFAEGEPPTADSPKED